MKILVVGAGATGGYFGAKLAQAGRDVTFLVRPRRAEVLRDRGLRIIEPDGESVLHPTLVETGGITGTYDLVLLSVKATALAAAIEDFTPAVGPDTLILPVLNGMTHIDVLEDRFGPAAVLGGVAKVVTTVDGNGDIVRIGGPHVLTYGTRSTPAPPALAEVHHALSDAGFDSAVSEDITQEMWAKWAFITATGAITSLMRGSIGEVMAAPGGQDFAEAVVAEASAIVAGAGHPMTDKEHEFLRVVATTPGSPFTSSLYRDLVAGQSVEVEHLFGEFVALADHLGVPVPLLRLTTTALRVHQARI